jgi:hypothetical protein
VGVIFFLPLHIKGEKELTTNSFEKSQESCYNTGMRFLPDSAILGTLGHIKHATKKKRSSAVGLPLLRDRHSYYYPQRTTQELLALAGHARKTDKAGK